MPNYPYSRIALKSIKSDVKVRLSRINESAIMNSTYEPFMKGKSTFSKVEALQIEALIEQKLQASTSAQKVIRNKIRALRFFASDFGLGGGGGGYTVADFRRVVTITGSGEAQNNGEPVKQSRSVLTEISNPGVKTIPTLNFDKPIISQLENLGFKGFVTIDEIRMDYSQLPNAKGIYLILHSLDDAMFIETGTGGYFKMRNPNVSIDVLAMNWVSDSPILYIGKAGSLSNSANLRSRLTQYFRFGQGKAVGHWGGRYIWQLENPYDLIVCWKEIENDEPAFVESAFIRQFTDHFGKRPFANLKD